MSTNPCQVDLDTPRSRLDVLLDVRLNVQARLESGSYTEEQAAWWFGAIDRKIAAL